LNRQLRMRLKQGAEPIAGAAKPNGAGVSRAAAAAAMINGTPIVNAAESLDRGQQSSAANAANRQTAFEGGHDRSKKDAAAKPLNLRTAADGVPYIGNVTEDRFAATLKRYWGYDAFRPKQEEIVRALVAGRDVCVVMPTGGGKSLCYQLPAALAERKTAVVISPLIALMQDQVAQLRQMGIPAVFLNSAVAESERQDIKRRAIAGEYRLMYVSPERVVMDATSDWLTRMPVSFFAIDEAHCISEWGHDFRPEYRQLRKLREMIPGLPIAAFTASATQRVRHDIVEQLKLRNPLKSVTSFHRENLHYVVKECPGVLQDELMFTAVKNTRQGNVIVYSPTVARVGEIVDMLEENGIAAVGYHGQMGARERSENQERWMTEEVRVLVGTIAFGLGINKPNVRAVIRLGLPESIEQLYQETGRAGRDGLPANCYLLWQKRDIGLRAYFIGKIGAAAEKEKAWERYNQMQRFVDASDCRPRMICEHFGETVKWKECGHCDTCAGMPALMAGESKSRKGKQKRMILPARRTEVYAGGYSGVMAADVNEDLQDFLREWRRNKAKEKGVAAFLVLHDTTIEALCRVEPENREQLLKVSGIGESKAELYGTEILEVIKRFKKGDRASKDWHAQASSPVRETLELLQQGLTFDEIAARRGRRVSTVVALISSLIEKGETEFKQEWMDPAHYRVIRETGERLGMDLLRPIKDALGEEVSYEEIRLVIAHLRRKEKAQHASA
jgi:ATP-dependent DNA helicase RecQ